MRETKQTGYGGAIPLPLGQPMTGFPSGNNADNSQGRKTMAQRGRPKKIEKQIEEAQERMRELWAEKREKASAEKGEAMANLTSEQQIAISKSNEALREFVQEFGDMFDVSTDTARKLQNAFWAMHNAFGDE